jgi:hypothetical protein
VGRRGQRGTGGSRAAEPQRDLLWGRSATSAAAAQGTRWPSPADAAGPATRGSARSSQIVSTPRRDCRQVRVSRRVTNPRPAATSCSPRPVLPGDGGDRGGRVAGGHLGVLGRPAGGADAAGLSACHVACSPTARRTVRSQTEEPETRHGRGHDCCPASAAPTRSWPGPRHVLGFDDVELAPNRTDRHGTRAALLQ